MTQCPNRLLLVTSSLSARSSRRIRKGAIQPELRDHGEKQRVGMTDRIGVQEPEHGSFMADNRLNLLCGSC
jgi:hypothetical protein